MATTNMAAAAAGLSSAQEQLDQVWERLSSSNKAETTSANPPREWPTYDAVLKNMNQANYQHTLTCPFDFSSSSNANNNANTNNNNNSKVLCPHGVVVRAEFEVFDNDRDGTQTYTGLLRPAQTHRHCLLRLSSAMQPPKHQVSSFLARAVLYSTGEKLRTAQLFPAAALKVFVDVNTNNNTHNTTNNDNTTNNNNNNTNKTNRTRNLLLGGSKIGQRETDFFAHCLCTSMTERMPRAVRPLVQTFWKYSDYPLSLGVSDFCTDQQHQHDDDNIEFPFAIIFKPVYQTPASTDDDNNDNTNNNNNNNNKASFDRFVDHALTIPAGTLLYDVYTCRTPDDVVSQYPLQRIGRIRTTSAFQRSGPDDHLFFRHQPKEDDYARKPAWKAVLSQKVSRGELQGTVGQLVGWKLFEQQLERGNYVNYQQQQHDEEGAPLSS